MTLRRYDALIVGGGPAGSTVAGALQRAGLEIAVLDKAEFPRDKTCAGWITPAVLEVLRITPEEYHRDGRTLQPIRAFRIAWQGTDVAPVTVRYDHVASYGIRRCELDDFLLRRSGADLILGTPLRSFERHGETWRVNDEIETPLLIGAGGHFCPVARRLAGARHEPEPIVVAQEVELCLEPAQASACRVDAARPELYFDPDLQGYGWCFRKEGVLNVGLGRLLGAEPRLGERVQEFVCRLQDEGRIPPDLGRMRGHAYLLHGHGVRPAVAEGALLVGDAAGLAYPASGEGIRPAVESALLAAQVALEAAGDYSAARLRPYENRLVRRLGKSRKAPRWVAAGVAHLLQRSPTLTRRLLVERFFLRRDLQPLQVLPELVASSSPATAA